MGSVGFVIAGLWGLERAVGLVRGGGEGVCGAWRGRSLCGGGRRWLLLRRGLRGLG